MGRLRCPYLACEVELSEERERHIAEQHPDLLPDHRQCIIETVGDPDEVRLSKRSSNTKLLSRWFGDLRGGKHCVVVIVSEAEPAERHWVITAYIARRLAEGDIEWQRS
jgi:hypothetical protein